MIIDELTLYNFGVYKGHQTIKLTPPDKSKPVILFGGLNGSGKTTILDALLLVLYGKHSSCSKRGQRAYDKFLLDYINRDSDPRDGAVLTLTFRQTSEGREHQYRISRAWSSTTNGVREVLNVIKDGGRDTTLEANWMEMVETIMPSRIADLFFFDGEKIEEIANGDNASQFLATGINSLLGLNIIQQLKADLATLERRKRIAMKQDVDQKRVKDAEDELKNLERDRELLTRKRGNSQMESEKLGREIQHLGEQYKKAGGENYDQCANLENKEKKLCEEMIQCENNLREKAAGSFPLALVDNLLGDVLDQAMHEEDARKRKMLVAALKGRDDDLLVVLKKLKVDRSILSTVKMHLENDRNEQDEQAASIQIYLNLSPDGVEQIRTLLRVAIPADSAEVKELVAKYESLKLERENVVRRIEMIPDPASINGISSERRKKMVEKERLSVKIEALDMEIHEVTVRITAQERQVIKLLESAADEEFEQDDVKRFITHVQQMQQVLDQFQSQIMVRDLNQLERLILESIQMLLRKKSLIYGLTISPKDFSLTLRGNTGKVLSSDHLSAGERQLLAVSMLWGLAKSSGLPLPAIIDTPLGRLDSSHRCNLVERYFPNASHQVILLSTDEEICAGYFDKLRESIGHMYRLDYDDQTKITTVNTGYFW